MSDDVSSRGIPTYALHGLTVGTLGWGVQSRMPCVQYTVLCRVSRRSTSVSSLPECTATRVILHFLHDRTTYGICPAGPHSTSCAESRGVVHQSTVFHQRNRATLFYTKQHA
jgi:hypothetical protein